MKKFLLNKLVRNNVPSMLAEKNIKVDYKIITEDKTFVFLLKKKLLEEANELLRARGRQNNLEELVDIMDVFFELLRFYRCSFTNLVLLSEKKKNERGSFEARNYIHSILIDETNPMIKFFQNYKEIKNQEIEKK